LDGSDTGGKTGGRDACGGQESHDGAGVQIRELDVTGIVGKGHLDKLEFRDVFVYAGKLELKTEGRGPDGTVAVGGFDADETRFGAFGGSGIGVGRHGRGNTGRIPGRAG